MRKLLLLVGLLQAMFINAPCRADAQEQSSPGKAPPGMVWIPGGSFTMGSKDDSSRLNEGPPHTVRVDGFWMDLHAVTNAQFEQFVKATGYRTTAEKAPSWEELKKQLPSGAPKPDESLLVAGSNVWQWCSNWYRPDTFVQRAQEPSCHNPSGPHTGWNPTNPSQQERVTKGGSFLCHISYCESYRPSARRGTPPDTGMSHIGFRCVKERK